MKLSGRNVLENETREAIKREPEAKYKEDAVQ